MADIQYENTEALLKLHYGNAFREDSDSESGTSHTNNDLDLEMYRPPPYSYEEIKSRITVVKPRSPVMNTTARNKTAKEIVEEKLKTLIQTDYCYVCEAILREINNSKSHYASNRHRNNVKIWRQTETEKVKKNNKKKIVEKQNIDSKGYTLMTLDFCHVCNKNFSSPFNAKEHYDSKRHNKSVAQSLDMSYYSADIASKNSYDIQTDGRNSVKSQDVDDIISAEMEYLSQANYCYICKADLPGSSQAYSHYRSKRHVNRVETWWKTEEKKLKQKEKMRKECNENEKNSSLRCVPNSSTSSKCSLETTKLKLGDHIQRSNNMDDGEQTDQKLEGPNSSQQQLPEHFDDKESLLAVNPKKSNEISSLATDTKVDEIGNIEEVESSADIIQKKQNTLHEALDRSFTKLEKEVSDELKKLVDTIYYSKKVPLEVGLEHLKKFNKQLDEAKNNLTINNAAKSTKDSELDKETQDLSDENKLEFNKTLRSVKGIYFDGNKGNKTDKVTLEPKKQNSILETENLTIPNQYPDIQSDKLIECNFDPCCPEDVQILDITLTEEIESNVEMEVDNENEFKETSTNLGQKNDFELNETEDELKINVLNELNQFVDLVSDGILEETVIISCLKNFNKELEDYLQNNVTSCGNTGEGDLNMESKVVRGIDNEDVNQACNKKEKKPDTEESSQYIVSSENKAEENLSLTQVDNEIENGDVNKNNTGENSSFKEEVVNQIENEDVNENNAGENSSFKEEAVNRIENEDVNENNTGENSSFKEEVVNQIENEDVDQNITGENSSFKEEVVNQIENEDVNKNNAGENSSFKEEAVNRIENEDVNENNTGENSSFKEEVVNQIENEDVNENNTGENSSFKGEVVNQIENEDVNENNTGENSSFKEEVVNQIENEDVNENNTGENSSFKGEVVNQIENEDVNENNTGENSNFKEEVVNQIENEDVNENNTGENSSFKEEVVNQIENEDVNENNTGENSTFNEEVVNQIENEDVNESNAGENSRFKEEVVNQIENEDVNENNTGENSSFNEEVVNQIEDKDVNVICNNEENISVNSVNIPCLETFNEDLEDYLKNNVRFENKAGENPGLLQETVGETENEVVNEICNKEEEETSESSVMLPCLETFNEDLEDYLKNMVSCENKPEKNVSIEQQAVDGTENGDVSEVRNVKEKTSRKRSFFSRLFFS